MRKKLVLSSDSFLWRKGTSGLIFNPKSGTHLRFSTMNPAMDELCRLLEDPINLYTAEFDSEEIDDEFRAFVTSVEGLKLGKVVQAEEKTLAIPPSPFVINHVERMTERGMEQFGIQDYLSTVTFHLGGAGEKNGWYRQVDYPFGSKERLDVSKTLLFIGQLNRNTAVRFVVAEAGDGRVSEIISHLDGRSVSFLFNPASYPKSPFSCNGYGQRGQCKFILRLSPEDIDREPNRESDSLFKHPDHIDFLVDSPGILQKTEALLDRFCPGSHAFIPVWNCNPLFLAENVLLSEEEILSSNRSKRKIHLHQLLNINYWGQLTVMPDGQVYSDVNKSPLGSLDDSPVEIIANELTQNHAWRRIRELGKCAGCLYQWLCPSPSAFEQLSGMAVCNDVTSGLQPGFREPDKA